VRTKLHLNACAFHGSCLINLCFRPTSWFYCFLTVWGLLEVEGMGSKSRGRHDCEPYLPSVHFNKLDALFLFKYQYHHLACRIPNTETDWLYLPTYLYVPWLYSPLSDLNSVFSFLILYTVSRTPWTEDQPVARPLPTHITQSQNKRTETSMPRVGFEAMIPVFERAIRPRGHYVSANTRLLYKNCYHFFFCSHWRLKNKMECLVTRL
jgi:hypothetical protein